MVYGTFDKTGLDKLATLATTEQINRLKLYIYFSALATDYHVCVSIVDDCKEFIDCLVEEDMLVLGKYTGKISNPSWDKFQTLMADKHHEIPQWVHDL